MVLLRMTSLKVMSFPRNPKSSHGLTGHGLKATMDVRVWLSNEKLKEIK
jgi:hypothetical protein